MLDYFLNKFWNYRKAFGLSFFYFGAPIVYFLRDGIGLAPGNSLFTAVFTLGPLIFVIPSDSFKRFYQPNVTAYTLSFIFLFLALFYLIFYCPNAGWFTNIPYSLSNFAIIFGMFTLLASVSVNELREKFVPVTFVIATLGCLFLVYYLARNPLYVIGMKAGVSLGSGDETTTNSHIFGRGGYVAAFSGIILLKNATGTFKRLCLLGGIGIGFIILVLAQSMSSLFAFGLALALYLYYNVSLPSVINKSYQMLWNWRFQLVMILMIFAGIAFWEKFNGTITNVYNIVGGRLDRIVNTLALGGDTKDWRTSDISAKDRLGSIQKVFKGLQDNYEDDNVFPLLFGNGYEKLYVDSPIVQSFNDFGLLGFLLYVSMFFILVRSMLLGMKEKNNDFFNLICFVFCLILVQNFSAGMVIDYPKWSYFALIARFGIPSITYAKPSAMIQTA